MTVRLSSLFALVASALVGKKRLKLDIRAF
jgi:hypothetical protein